MLSGTPVKVKSVLGDDPLLAVTQMYGTSAQFVVPERSKSKLRSENCAVAPPETPTLPWAVVNGTLYVEVVAALPSEFELPKAANCQRFEPLTLPEPDTELMEKSKVTACPDTPSRKFPDVTLSEDPSISTPLKIENLFG